MATLVTEETHVDAALEAQEVVLAVEEVCEKVEKDTVVEPVAVVAPEATPVTSKRAAKKNKKHAKPNDASADADAENNTNIAATIDHPYLSFLHKRIRLYKKKLEKIKALETAQATDGKVLNDQQLELVGSKALVDKMITEFETLREQFIDVYVKEEALKKKAAATAETTAKKAEEETTTIKMEEPVEIKEPEDANQTHEEVESVVEIATSIVSPVAPAVEIVPRDAFAYVEDLLRTLHAVTLHQALGQDVPMVLDYFSKVLLGTTRPPAEVPFDENLAESLEEATRYLTKSDKPVVMDVTYQDLRVMVEKLGVKATSAVSAVAEDAAVAETVAESAVVEAPAADELPQINFFTDSQLDPVVVDVAVSDDKINDHAASLEAIASPSSEEDEEQPQVEEERVEKETVAVVAAPTTTVPQPTKKPRNRKTSPSGATGATGAANGSGDEKPAPRRRSQNRSKNHSNNNSPRGTGVGEAGKSLEGGAAAVRSDNQSGGVIKQRRSRPPARANDENNNNNANYNRGAPTTAGGVGGVGGGKQDDRRARSDRPVRKPQQPQHKQAPAQV